MESMFQWFYDILVLTVTALFIYSSARRGFSKIAVIMVGYVLCIFTASAISKPLSEGIYNKFIQKKNISEISQNIEKLNFSQKYQSYLDNLEYNIKTDSNKLENIFTSDTEIIDKVYFYCNDIKGNEVDTKEGFTENFKNGYSDIIFETLKTDIPKYSLSTLYSENFNVDESISVLYQGTDVASKYIEENFIKSNMISLTRKILFIIIFLAFMFIIRIVSDKINQKSIIRSFGIPDRIIGAVMGLAEAVLILGLIASAVKILVLLGSDEMMLFNSETIEKTKIFRHIYNLKYIK